MSLHDQGRARLLLFAKVPVPGRVKTRLCPPLTPEQAAELYAAFLRDVCVASARLGAFDVRLCAWNDGSAPTLLEETALKGLEARIELLPQSGIDLAARMLAAIEEAQDGSETPLVLRNTDSPDLDPARIDEALAALRDGADLVLGPDAGGGYYLIGVRGQHPALAEIVASMRTVEAEHVFAEAMTRAREARLATFVLPPASDVDLPEDLARLRARLREDPTRAPATARALEDLPE